MPNRRTVFVVMAAALVAGATGSIVAFAEDPRTAAQAAAIGRGQRGSSSAMAAAAIAAKTARAARWRCSIPPRPQTCAGAK